jgi:hypothetical protein
MAGSRLTTPGDFGVLEVWTPSTPSASLGT